ncbi:type III-B CRISPR module RAMP protein Cmr1 [Thermodesulfatator autotrophicus]|uniref:CRISPR type III-associated protein domain-containing protein n=1 Tax=Thermodesulfatator autotrophicus TaxID=1795632 RepID=A0A177E9B6_9BACT|nr:type III-B CRISPR module RAMP protein Cmr1 [Thermodesulfatator autotrophicus]OAG28554.1 hypothetical protein TH606_00945 [Thermodesulfatator autotrophicus]
MDPLKVKIKTLTPLYTGGVDGTMDRIHETGILGSLRWWYEAIVRGLGGSACDVTGDHRCPDKDGRYCDVCAVFGTTGLQRAFRLEGPVWWNEKRGWRLEIKVNNNRGWFLGRGFMGGGEMHLRALRLPEGWAESDLWQTVLLTFRLIACWGGLGPKTQQGYGVVCITSDDKKPNVVQALKAFDKLKGRPNRRNVAPSPDLPSLGGFFFARIRFPLDNPEQWLRTQTTRLNPNKEDEKTSVLPLAPVARYHLRQLIRNHIQYNGHPNAPARWQLMGVVNGLWHVGDFGKIEEIDRWYCSKCHQEWDHRPSKEEHKNCSGKPRKKAQCEHCNTEWNSLRDVQKDSSTKKVERQRALIHVSHAYPAGNERWEFRIWGWIPEGLPGGVTRKMVLSHLRTWLGVSQERQWHTAATDNNTLWQRLSLDNVKICWFARQNGEKVGNYIQALLEGCSS